MIDTRSAATAQSRRARRHGLDTRRNVSHGVHQLLSRGASGPRGHGRWLLDGSLHRDQRAVRALRCRHRIRHPGRAAAATRGLPWRAARESGAGFDGVPEAQGTRRSAQLRQLVGMDAGRELAPSLGSTQFSRRSRSAPGRARRLRGRRGVRALGQQGTAHRSRVGTRGARWTGWGNLCLGPGRVRQRPADDQRLAGRVSLAEPPRRRL